MRNACPAHTWPWYYNYTTTRSPLHRGVFPAAKVLPCVRPGSEEYGRVDHTSLVIELPDHAPDRARLAQGPREYSTHSVFLYTAMLLISPSLRRSGIMLLDR